MNIIHTANGFNAPLTAQSNLLESSAQGALLMVAVLLVFFLFVVLTLRTLLNRPGMPVRIKNNRK